MFQEPNWIENANTAIQHVGWMLPIVEGGGGAVANVSYLQLLASVSISKQL